MPGVKEGGQVDKSPVLATVEFSVNMTCQNCEDKIKNVLTEKGVDEFKINYETQSVQVTSNKTTDELKSCIEKTGKVAVLVGQGGLGGGKSGLGAAVAMLGKEGDFFTPGTQGVIRFNQINRNSCVIEGTIDGLPPGEHGLAVHEAGDVSQGCATLGEHFNPRNVRHGSPENVETDRHAGDLGNIMADQNGRATFRIVDNVLKVWDIIGRGIVISENKDDLGLGSSVLSKVNGNCGSGLACGIIARSAGLGENTKKICQCDGVTIWDERNKPLVGPGRREK
jgi:copper chaperone for superoxide dismutase